MCGGAHAKHVQKSVCSKSRLKMEARQVEQCSCVKITVLCSRNAQQCYADLSEALGDHALTYRTVERWEQGFRSGRESTVDKQCSGCRKVPELYARRKFSDFFNRTQDT
jgi:hypothetical protein